MNMKSVEEIQWFLLENFKFVKMSDPITLTFNKTEYVYTLKYEYTNNDGIIITDRLYKDPNSGKVVLTVGNTERLQYDSLSEFFDKASKFYFEKWECAPQILTFPVAEDDPSWEPFDKIKPLLFKELDNYRNWSMSVVRRGLSEKSSVPTIVVVCPTKINFKTEIPENLKIFQVQEMARHTDFILN